MLEVAARARSSMDRASDFGSEGWGFKSLRAHHSEFLGVRKGGPNSTVMRQPVWRG